ncbi:hypothetical protein COTS27_00546 [Spirochaetota bacterium]|nr:hypothetical protein COTS27_00546 [Spirochaetota bacterium]
MDYLLLGYLITFSLIVIAVLRHYTYRMGLPQLSEFIKHKEYELNSKLVSGLAELEDISINLEVDVKKYHHLKKNLETYMHDLDKRKYAFDTTFKKIDAFFETIKKQNRSLELAHHKNESLLAQLRTSEDAVKLYEQRIIKLATAYKDIKTDLSTYSDRNTKNFKAFTQKQTDTLKEIEAALHEKIKEQFQLSEQTVTNDLRRLETDLAQKIKSVGTLETEQGKLIEANLNDFTKNIKIETQKHLDNERNYYLQAKKTLVDEITQELDTFSTSVAQELKDSQTNLDKLKDQLALTSDLLAPVEERIDTIEEKIDTWETQSKLNIQDTHKWVKAFTKQKDQFMKQTLSSHLTALGTEFETSLKTVHQELTAFQTEQKDKIVNLVEKASDQFSAELKREVLLPERMTQFETTFTNAKAEILALQKEISQFKLERQAEIKTYQASLVELIEDHEERVQKSFTTHLKDQAEFFKTHENLLNEYTKTHKEACKELEKQTQQKVTLIIDKKLKQANEQGELIAVKFHDSLRKLDTLQTKFKSFDNQVQTFETDLSNIKAKFVVQVRKRDSQLAHLETEYHTATQKSLHQAQAILKDLLATKQQELVKLLQALEVKLSHQNTTLTQFQTKLHKKLTPELNQIKKQFQNDFNQVITSSRAQLDTLVAELKQNQTTIVAKTQTQQNNLMQDLKQQLQTQLNDWEANITTKISDFHTTTTQDSEFIQKTHQEFIEFKKNTFPTLTERYHTLETNLHTLETSYHHYDQIFKEAADEHQDLKKFIENITEKIHGDVEHFATWLDDERLKIDEVVTEKIATQTTIKDAAQSFNDYLADKRAEIDNLTDKDGIKPIVANFSKFLQDKKALIEKVVAQRLNDLHNLSTLTDLEAIITQEPNDSKKTLPDRSAHLPTTEPAPSTTLRGRLINWLEPKTLPHLDDEITAHQTRQMLQNLEKRINAKFNRFEKVFTLESNFTNQATNQVKGLEKNFIAFFDNTKQNIIAYITAFKSQLTTEAKTLQSTLNEKLAHYQKAYQTTLNDNISASDKKINTFLQSSREEFLTYRNSVIEDYTHRINDHLNTSYEKLDKYLHTFEANLKQNIEKLIAKHDTQLRRSHKDYQKSTGKLQQFNTSINAIAVMEARHEKILKATHDQYEKLKRQTKDFIHHYLHKENINTLIETALENTLKTKISRIEKQVLLRSPLKTDLIAMVKDTMLEELTSLQKLNAQPSLTGKSLAKSTSTVLPIRSSQPKKNSQPVSFAEQLKQHFYQFIRTEVTAQVTHKLTHDIVEAAIRDVTAKATQKVTDQATLSATHQATATLNKTLTDQITKRIDTQVTTRVNEELAKEIATSTTYLKKLVHDGKTLMASQKRQVTKLMVQTQKTIGTHKDELLSEFSKKLSTFDKELALLVKKVKAFTEDTKVFQKTNTLSQRLSEKISAYEKHLSHLITKEKHLKTLDTKMQQTLEREKDLITFTKDLKRKEHSVKNIQEKLEHVFSFSENLTERMNALKEQQQYFETFSKDLKSYETPLKQFKAEFSKLQKKDGFLKETRGLIEKLLTEQKNISIASQQLDENINITAEREHAITHKFKSLEEQAAILENHYKAFKGFDEKYNQLDYLIEDLEQRKLSIEEMRKRLAIERSELHNLKKDFNNQISVVLKALYQKQNTEAKTTSATHTKTAASEKSNHPLDKIATVERLHAIGWSNHDIASHLNMQTHEVEIILKQSRS